MTADGAVGSNGLHWGAASSVGEKLMSAKRVFLVEPWGERLK